MSCMPGRDVKIDAILAIKEGVTILWTGLLDWNTGLDYWTELFSFFGQVSVFICRKKPNFLQ